MKAYIAAIRIIRDLVHATYYPMGFPIGRAAQALEETIQENRQGLEEALDG